MNIRKLKKPKTRRYVMGALPTPERHRHQGGLRCGFVKAERSGAFVPRYRARWANPLDLYREQQIINRDEYQAGLEFGRAYQHAVSSIPACHERTRLFSAHEVPAEMHDTPLIRALAYVERAYRALTTDAMNVVIDVCAYERPVESNAELGILRKGLRHLVFTWGMASTELCNRMKE